MFKIGDYVRLDNRVGDRIDTEIGIVEKVEQERKGELVSVFWEKAGNNDGGPWRATWLIKI